MEKIDNKMKYDYTIYISDDEERYKSIAEDILIEYPRLGLMADRIARMERVSYPAYDEYVTFNEQENRINRLINIVIVTEDNEIFECEYNKACKDLLINYQSWLSWFSNKNIENQPVYLIMQSFWAHKSNKSIPILTLNQAVLESNRRNISYDLKESADKMRQQIPELGEIADQAAYAHMKYGRHLRSAERDLSNLVIAIKIMENQPGFNETIKKTLSVLRKEYIEWLCNYGFKEEFDDQRKIIITMMDRLQKHLNGENIEIASYIDIFNEYEDDFILRKHQN